MYHFWSLLRKRHWEKRQLEIQTLKEYWHCISLVPDLDRYTYIFHIVANISYISIYKLHVHIFPFLSLLGRESLASTKMFAM